MTACNDPQASLGRTQIREWEWGSVPASKPEVRSAGLHVSLQQGNGCPILPIASLYAMTVELIRTYVLVSSISYLKRSGL